MWSGGVGVREPSCSTRALLPPASVPEIRVPVQITWLGKTYR